MILTILILVWLFCVINGNAVRALIGSMCHLYLAIRSLRCAGVNVIKSCWFAMKTETDVHYFSRVASERKHKLHLAEFFCAFLESGPHLMLTVLSLCAAIGHCLLGPVTVLGSLARQSQQEILSAEAAEDRANWEREQKKTSKEHDQIQRIISAMKEL